MERLERLIGGNGVDDEEGNRLTGEEALAWVDGRGFSVVLGLAQTRAVASKCLKTDDHRSGIAASQVGLPGDLGHPGLVTARPPELPKELVDLALELSRVGCPLARLEALQLEPAQAATPC